jgi:hypothetical protein
MWNRSVLDQLEVAVSAGWGQYRIAAIMAVYHYSGGIFY